MFAVSFQWVWRFTKGKQTWPDFGKAPAKSGPPPLRFARRASLRCGGHNLQKRRYTYPVSPNTVARLLYQMDFSLRVNRKSIATNSSRDRDQQFQYIASLRTPLRAPEVTRHQCE